MIDPDSSPKIEAAAAATATTKAVPTDDGVIEEVKGGSRANTSNLLNILGYFISLAVSYLGGVAGWFGGVTNAELSSRYQTLITPSASYFLYVWMAIFLLEGFFAVAQLLPKYREQPLVQLGIGSVYCIACMCQASWAIFFGYEMMVSAFVAIFFLLVALLVIIKRQWDVVEEEERKTSTSISLGETTLEEMANDTTARPPRISYWLLRFPFALHAGWIASATPVMLCVILVSQGVDPSYEMWAAVISLPLLFGCCMGLLLREDSGAPAYAFPGTVAYACAGICWELQAPSDVILGRHDEASINLMKNLSGFCGICLAVVMVSRFIVLFLRDQCVKWHSRPETVEIDGEVFPYVQA